MDISNMQPKKYAKMQEKLIMHSNVAAPSHQHRPSPVTAVKLSERARKIMDIKRQESYALPKLPGAALPRTIIHGKGTYDGAELRPYDGRAGSMAAYAIKSRGISA